MTHTDVVLQAVSAHEKSMREQAKKMNVASLRSADAAQKSAEGKLAKASLPNIENAIPMLATNHHVGYDVA